MDRTGNMGWEVAFQISWNRSSCITFLWGKKSHFVEYIFSLKLGHHTIRHLNNVLITLSYAPPSTFFCSFHFPHHTHQNSKPFINNRNQSPNSVTYSTCLHFNFPSLNLPSPHPPFFSAVVFAVHQQIHFLPQKKKKKKGGTQPDQPTPM